MRIVGLNNTYNSESYNEGYSPDVITIKKSDINELQNIIGEYLIKVKGITFSSYSLLYYTHENLKYNEKGENNTQENDENKPIFSKVINLQTGQIIKDFIIEYPNATNYKIYSYNPKILPNQTDMDIRITLTPEHSEYKVYVLFDIENLKFNYSINAFNSVENSIWESNYSNEIIIKKDHQQYQKNKNYYIIIVPTYTYNQLENSTELNNTLSNSTMYLNSFFYLGVTNEFFPFVLQESFPSTISLDSHYNQQSFWYFHYNTSNPVSLSLNLFYGRVDVLVDFNWSGNNTLSKNILKILDTDSTYFTISPEKLKENSKNSSSIGLYILIRKSSTWDAQFLLTIKSDFKRPEQLKPGVIKQDSLLSGEFKYFFLNIRKGVSGILNSEFKIGVGNMFINIFDNLDTKNLNNFPNITSFHYKGNNNYFGKTFSFNSQILSKCISGNCKVLIAIYGSKLDYSEDKIEYRLSFYQDSLLINQNQPYKSQIEESEMKFFRVYFPKNTQNAYISLTNMGIGDADLYVNYGDELPSLAKFIWSSATPNSEFVEFNINDNYFVSNNKTDISGNYTIMVYGYSKTTYTLYVTTHPNKIISLEENSGASCFTNLDNEYCYFRFDDLYLSYWDENGYGTDEDNYNKNNKKDLTLIFNTEYIYGAGIIYAKLYNGNDYDLLKDFPNEHVYDYSNVNSNIRNFLKLNLKADNPNFNLNSTILVTIKCREKCFFDVIATKQYDSTIMYLESNRENIYYISQAQNKKNLFIYYNNKQGDIDILTKALEGKSNIRIYTNNTIYNEVTRQYHNSINEIVNFESFFPQKENIHITLSYENLTLYENIYFEINPITDYTFAMRLSYKHDWNMIKMGSLNIFKLNGEKKRFYGYFNMNDMYNNIMLTISLNKINLTALVYAKFKIYDKYSDLVEKSSNQFYEVPSENDNDFSGDNNNLMNLVTIKLPKIPAEKLIDKNNNKKYVRVLFSINIFDKTLEDTEESNNNTINNNSNEEVEIKIVATPEINNISKTALAQKTISYSLLNGFEKMNNSTIQIYDLKRKNKEDDTLIVEISSCKGEVDMSLSKKVLNNIRDADEARMTPSNIDHSNGRTVYTFTNLDSNFFYMMLSAKKVPEFYCKPTINGKEFIYSSCESTNVLVYYYTFKSNEKIKETIIPRESIIYEITGKDKIKLKWTPLYEKNDNDYNIYENKDMNKIMNETFKVVNASYQLFISNSLNDYLYMDSICYLNKMNITTLKWKLKNNNKEAEIYGLELNKKYFLNILAKRFDNGEIISYKSIEVILENNGLSYFYIGKICNL